MFNRNKLQLSQDEIIVYDAKKRINEKFLIAVILLLLLIIFAIFQFLFLHRIITFTITTIATVLLLYSILKLNIFHLLFTNRRIIIVKGFEIIDVHYEDIYDLTTIPKKHRLLIYLFNGDKYVYTNYKNESKLLEVVSQYLPQLDVKRVKINPKKTKWKLY
ncbi:MAG: hypothetical protein WCK67_13025 [bacterium]